MLGFFSIVTALMLVVLAGTWKLLPQAFPQALSHRLRKFVLLFDGISIVSLWLSTTLLQNMPAGGIGLQVLSIAFVIQAIFSLLMLLSIGGQYLYHRIGQVPLEPSRRILLTRAVAFPAVAAAAGLYGGFYERRHTEVTRHVLTIPGLCDALQGFTIAQISDVHLGAFYSLQDLENLLEGIAKEKPDVLVITGDLFDDNDINDAAAVLVQRYTARFSKGIWFCRGNHEHKRGMAKIEAALQKTDIHELVNAHQEVIGGGQPLYFAGVDYPMDRQRFAELEKAYSQAALTGIPADAITILLAHHPDFLDDAAAYGVHLTLSGHTHGGQIGFLGHAVLPMYKYMRGMYRQGKSWGYVHRGNGSWFPYRWGCPPEIAYFCLKRV